MPAASGGGASAGGRYGKEMLSSVRPAVLYASGMLGAVSVGALAALPSGNLVLMAVAGVGLLVWLPAPALILTLLLAQEVKSGFGFSGMTVFGAQLYFGLVGKVPMLVVVVGTAALAATIQLVLKRDGTRILPPTVLLAITLAIGTGAAGIAAGMDPTSALGQVARPFLLFLLAWTVGRSCGSNASTVRAAGFAAAAGIVLLAALGLPAALAGGSILSGQLVYYDTATAAIAGAILLAILRSEIISNGRIALAACSAIVLLVSFRRSVFLSLIIILTGLFIANKRSRKMVWRVLLWGGAFILAGGVLFPNLVSTFLDRLLASYATLEGTENDVSTAGHVDDITVGLRYAIENPWGYGPTSPQLTGLFVKTGSLYVHNELLLDWLRFGLVGLAVILAFFASTLVDTFKALRSGRQSPPLVVAAAAFFVPVFLIASVTAPFLTTTGRWPALLGLTTGILAGYQAVKGPPVLVSKTKESHNKRPKVLT